MEQYDEDGSVKAFYEKEAPGLWGMNSTETGELYFVSYMYPVGGRTVIDKATGESYVRLNPRGLSIRRDWVDAIGEEWKDVYTPEELRDLFVKFREKDANGNGAADEVVHLEIEGFNNGIAKAFGMTDRLIAGYFNNENVVFSNFQHENFAAYVKFMQSLVEAGVYDTAALTTGREEMISQNRVSAAHYYCATEFEVDLPETSPEDEYLYYPVYIDLDGDITNGFNYTADGDEPTAYTQFFVPEGAKNKEGAAILIDYIFSDEYAVLNQFGLEGKGYELDENGNYVKLKNEEDPNQTLAPGDVGCEWYLGCVWNLPKLSETHLSSKGQTHAYMKAKEDWVLDFHLNTRQYLENYEWRTQNLAIESEEEAAVLNEISPVLETYCQELITDLVLGRKSLDDMPTYLEELEELGLQDYIDIMQARRDRVVGQ